MMIELILRSSARSTIAMGGMFALLVNGACSDDTCETNADCADSQAAEDVKDLRCGLTEVYCLAGTCKGGCRTPCEPASALTNPCTSPELCASLPGPEVAKPEYMCTIKPITCESEADCPAFTPPVGEGKSSTWTCDRHVCRYPGIEYGTK